MSVLRDALDYSMQEGMSIRVRECDHCVGMGNSMAVQISRKEDGFLWHCFRCSKSGFFPDAGASESQVKKMVETTAKKKFINRPKVVTLPDDYTTTIPPKGLVELYNMELDPDDIERYDIGWCPSRGRIIVPVYKYIGSTSGIAKKLVGIMGRKLKDDDKEKPKWWSQRQEDIKHPRFIAPSKAHRDCRSVVIVENCFSAIKTTKVTGWFGLALLTSYLPYELYEPLRRYTAVHIWLDADAYGKACKYQAALGNRGINSVTHVTDKKPKDCTLAEIAEELGVDNPE